jgi:hypothetical protein
VGQHELDIDALELDLDLVAGNVIALDADVALLSGDLVDIEAALGLLDTEVDGLQLNVSSLCDLVPLATC